MNILPAGFGKVGLCFRPRHVDRVLPSPDALDETRGHQEPQVRADGTLTGSGRVDELGRGLMGRIADQEPADEPAGNALIAEPGVELPQGLDKSSGFSVQHVLKIGTTDLFSQY